MTRTSTVATLATLALLCGLLFTSDLLGVSEVQHDALGLPQFKINPPLIVAVTNDSKNIKIKNNGSKNNNNNNKKNSKSKVSKWASEVEEYEYPPVNATLLRHTLATRHHRVAEKCHQVLPKEEMSLPINSKEFLINDKHHLIWCNIFKSASSSWLYNFIMLAGFNHNDMRRSQTSPVEFARKKAYPRPTVDKLMAKLGSNFTSFIVVRDPFERLLSAYRDKIESTAQVYYRKLRCDIHTADGGTKNRGKDCSPSFPAFVKYLLKENELGQPPNEHWAPYYSFCSPCQVHFEYILHFESLEEEEAFFVQEVGIGDIIKPQRLHSSHTNYTDLTTTYYAQLPRHLLLGLYHLYKKDFLIFGYDAGKYLKDVIM